MAHSFFSVGHFQTTQRKTRQGFWEPRVTSNSSTIHDWQHTALHPHTPAIEPRHFEEHPQCGIQRHPPKFQLRDLRPCNCQHYKMTWQPSKQSAQMKPLLKPGTGNGNRCCHAARKTRPITKAVWATEAGMADSECWPSWMRGNPRSSCSSSDTPSGPSTFWPPSSLWELSELRVPFPVPGWELNSASKQERFQVFKAQRNN